MDKLHRAHKPSEVAFFWGESSQLLVDRKGIKNQNEFRIHCFRGTTATDEIKDYEWGEKMSPNNTTLK